MNLYTTHYNNLRNLPDSIVPIAISRGIPPWFEGERYPALAPTRQIFLEYKKYHNQEKYLEDYMRSVLGLLNPHAVYLDLQRLTGGKDGALVCHCGAGDFCHRHIDTEWLSHALNISVVEW